MNENELHLWLELLSQMTEEEKAQARQAAMQRAEREAYANLMQPKKKKPATQPEPAEKVEQASLF